LTPLGCRTLFGMPARALWNTSVECADVAGPAGRELWDRLQRPAGWAERFATCDDVLNRLASTDLVLAPELRHAWHTLTRSCGTVPIATLATNVGWSRQHLARRFADEFGLGPKLAARVMRFERARRMLQTTLVRDNRPGRRRVRLLRPGATEPGLRRTGRMRANRVAGRGGASNFPRRRCCPRVSVASMTSNHAMVWPILSYRHARAAIAFLAEAFGFEERAVYAREDNPSVIEHAEMRWPLGGGIMFGTAGKDDSPFGQRVPGNDSVYVVCEDPDALFDRAVAAGAQVVRDLKDEDYGSRGFTVRDPEGNLWSFGTYAGE